METRNESDPQVFTTCVQCGQGGYELLNEVKLEDSAQ
jgi:hypothetical protein